MAAPKTSTSEEGGDYGFTGNSIYEIANAAAKEAKRANNKFSAAKQMPPDNLVRTALKKAIDGEIAYRLEEDIQGNGGRASQE